MIIARHTNEPVSAVRVMAAEDFLTYARISLQNEMAGSDMTNEERAEWIEEYIYGTDYSGHRDLRALLKKGGAGRR
jgi:hypothetical protein